MSLTRITLLRFKQDDKATLGWFITGSKLKLCATLEPPWKNNQRNNPKTKDNESSCIPEGVYICKKHFGVRYQNVWEITNVPGREGSLIHNGNYVYNTNGCILVGKIHLEYPKGVPFINDSCNTLNDLRKKLPDEFELEIICDGFSNKINNYNERRECTEDRLFAGQ